MNSYNAETRYCLCIHLVVKILFNLFISGIFECCCHFKTDEWYLNKYRRGDDSSDLDKMEARTLNSIFY